MPSPTPRSTPGAKPAPKTFAEPIRIEGQSVEIKLDPTRLMSALQQKLRDGATNFNVYSGDTTWTFDGQAYAAREEYMVGRGNANTGSTSLTVALTVDFADFPEGTVGLTETMRGHVNAAAEVMSRVIEGFGRTTAQSERGGIAE